MQAQSLTFGQVPGRAVVYGRAVKKNDDIRAWNLQLLIMECEAELGRTRGAAALLSARSEVKDSLISVLTSGKVHSDTGKARKIGDDTARKLEKGMSKPVGWMDVDHSAARDHNEAAYLDRLRLLTPSQREQLMQLMGAFSDANSAAGVSPGSIPEPQVPIQRIPRH
jgi:hypothetical protein